jgi:hypothetical protein
VFLRLRQRLPAVVSVLAHAAEKLARLPDGADVESVFPVDRIPESFGDYLTASNIEIATGQVAAIEAVVCLAHLADDKRAALPPIDREEVRMRCLTEWGLRREPAEISVAPTQAVEAVTLEAEGPVGWADGETESSELGAIIAACAVRNADRESEWIERPVFARRAIARPPSFFAFVK